MLCMPMRALSMGLRLCDEQPVRRGLKRTLLTPHPRCAHTTQAASSPDMACAAYGQRARTIDRGRRPSSGLLVLVSRRAIPTRLTLVLRHAH
jgi:hypothetical protein